MDQKEEQDLNELTPAVVTKYQAAADIVNKTLDLLLKNSLHGKTILELATLGDETITKLADSLYNKQKTKKGIAFPTCVSPYPYVCHLAPLQSDEISKTTIKQGDILAIELGAHVDGYIAQVAHTIVVGASQAQKITGKTAKLFKASALCIETALRLIKPGNNTDQVSKAINTITDEFDCKPSEGTLD